MRTAVLLGAALVAFAIPAHAQEAHVHSSMTTPAPAVPANANPKAANYAASNAKTMERMHAGMMGVALTGDPAHDFLSQMIPHHQGAIDMAKAALLASDDPTIRNLAQSIIVEQTYEIDLMTRLLAEKASANKDAPK
ncbi:DUF305 domain-containing protein [Methylopila sp. M107]|uniref:DUF305 domain-containing protein n=1 Tax=Methylopila sp. M107 TaxID=1101190 RepID=UPI00036AB37D|nr:DUF305 domain-containing protein [Methylopila sp. M107]